MMDLRRGAARWAAILLAAGMLAGCSTMGDDGIAANQQPDQLTPVTDSAVASTALPPIGGADGEVQVASADPSQTAPTNQPGMPVLPGAADPGMPAPNSPGQPAAPGSFVSLNDVGKISDTPGRDLSGGLTVEKLLGGWTVVSGADQCRLNLTYTAKTGTDRYRASAPGCAIPALAAVSSWQLSGTQVQLFNDADALVGALLLSGNRFIGTLSGGQAISMVG
jgi:hypothetical protein